VFTHSNTEEAEVTKPRVHETGEGITGEFNAQMFSRSRAGLDGWQVTGNPLGGVVHATKPSLG